MSSDFKLRLASLLRRAGLSKVSPRVLVGATLLCAVAVAAALWQFWPQQSEDFAYAGLEDSAAQAETGDAEGQVPQEAAAASAAPEQIAVDVEGEVNSPGLYMLAADARVDDAIKAAGGMTKDAQAHGVNRAARLEDGMQVYVPAEALQGDPAASGGEQASGAAAATGKVSLNSASVEELQTLPGIGPSLAQRIVDYRTGNGGFSSVDDLKNVSGIGDVRFENLKDLVSL